MSYINFAEPERSREGVYDNAVRAAKECGFTVGWDRAGMVSGQGGYSYPLIKVPTEDGLKQVWASLARNGGLYSRKANDTQLEWIRETEKTIMSRM